jgi:uncharacterized protein
MIDDNGGPIEGGPIELVVLQPTPFCPLSCDYCYLTTRDDRSRMSDAVLDAVGRTVLQQPWVSNEVGVLWHAGEPLVLPASWYERSFARLMASTSPDVRIRHSIQTSGIFLDRSRVSFLRSHDVAVGLSIDGPAWLHDKRRVTKSGAGTLKQALEGLHRLQDAGINPGVITVLGTDSLSVSPPTDRCPHSARNCSARRLLLGTAFGSAT